MKGFPNKPKKIIITKTPKGGGTPPGQTLLRQVLLALVIFFALVSIYSLISDASKPVEEISLSTLAQEISLEHVSSITVVVDDLDDVRH